MWGPMPETVSSGASFVRAANPGDGTGGRDRRRPSARWLVAIVWLAGVITLGLVARTRGLTPLELTDDFGQAIRGNWWGPAAFVVAYAIRPVIAFPGSLLTILAGVVFGPIWGSVWVIAGSNASTALTYTAGRFVGAGGDVATLPAAIVRPVERARQRPFVATMLMRLLYLPFDPVGWVAGFARLRFWPFLAGSAIGTVPGIVSFVGFGASIDAVGTDQPSLDLPLLGVSAALAVAGIALSRWLSARNDPSTKDVAPS